MKQLPLCCWRCCRRDDRGDAAVEVIVEMVVMVLPGEMPPALIRNKNSHRSHSVMDQVAVFSFGWTFKSGGTQNRPPVPF